MKGRITVLVDPEIADLVPDFLKEWKADILPMKKALENKEYDTIRKLAHDLKGMGGSCGLDVITDLGAALEAAAKKTDSDTSEKTINMLSSYLDKVELVVE